MVIQAHQNDIHLKFFVTFAIQIDIAGWRFQCKIETGNKERKEMASKTKKTEEIRARKHRANKENLKAEQKRIRKNLETLARIANAK